MKTNGNVPCNGCMECCRWGMYPRLYRPTTSLKYTVDGDCEHLDVLNGRCSIFGKPERPVQCVEFDCRELALRPEIETIFRVVRASFRLPKREVRDEEE